MLNVIDITSRLAKMSDPQLRQYAQMHKDDPYTLALAAAENKRRVQIRASGQPQAAEQPTVADQTIAQMGAPAPMPQQAPQAQPQPQLPEQQGIGMLPAQNVEGMADGGIAGYGDPYAAEYADGGMVAFAGEGPSLVEDTSSPVGRFFEQFRSPTAAKDYDAQQNRLAQERALVNKLQQLEGFGFAQQTKEQQMEAARVRSELSSLRSGVTTSAAPKALEQFQAPPPVAKEAGYAVQGKKKGEKANYPAPIDEGNVYTPRPLPTNSPYLDPNTYQNVDPSNLKTGTGKNSSGQRSGVGTTKDAKSGTAQASDFVPAKDTDLATEFARLQKMNPGTKAYDDLQEKIKKGYADLDKAREKDKPKGKAYEGLEALLGKEEEKAKGKEEKNMKMALINAGLAIAGGRSQNALQNIAEGAQVGTKQYQEGVEKLEAAALERRKQSAMIEEARRAEARGDFKEAQEYKRKAFEAELGVNQAQIAAVTDLYKVDSKTAADIVTNQATIAGQDRRTIYQQIEETKRARERNQNDRYVAGVNAAAYASRADQRGQITPALALKEYNDNLAKDPYGDFQKRYPTPQHYMAALQQMVNPTVINELPQNATVRK